MKTKYMTTQSIRNSINGPPLRRDLPRKQQLPRTQAMWIIRGILLIPLALALAWLALAPTVRAVLPAPDGGYLNGNTAEGGDALFYLNNGSDNTAIGFQALYNNRDGTANTAVGSLALNFNTGNYNTANGFGALTYNTTGIANTANGAYPLFGNTTGNYNTANGYQALAGIDYEPYSTGSDNTATGANALSSFTTGSDNTANGFGALEANTTGTENTANGVNALNQNTTGGGNTANGSAALLSNTGGVFNTADGAETLVSNLTGNDNTATGVFSLFYTTGNDNTADGYNALLNNTTGSSNIALGFAAGWTLTTGSNNIDIGNAGVAGESAKIRIGTKGTHKNTYIAGINGVTISRGVGVIIDTNGHLGTIVSSARFKDAIKPMDKASEAILALKPVTFRYKRELDPDGIPQFGLVAEQVEKVNPDLVARDDQGKPYTVRYEAVNAMLLNEFLKEHRKVEKQEATIAQLKSSATKQEAITAGQQEEIKAIAASLKEQASQIQKVSAQFEVTKPAPQMVFNNQ
jgi:hypothetical protein